MPHTPFSRVACGLTTLMACACMVASAADEPRLVIPPTPTPWQDLDRARLPRPPRPPQHRQPHAPLRRRARPTAAGAPHVHAHGRRRQCAASTPTATSSSARTIYRRRSSRWSQACRRAPCSSSRWIPRTASSIPGIARDVFGTVDPTNPKTLIVETHAAALAARHHGLHPGAIQARQAKAPFIVMHDGPKLGRAGH